MTQLRSWLVIFTGLKSLLTISCDILNAFSNCCGAWSGSSFKNAFNCLSWNIYMLPRCQLYLHINFHFTSLGSLYRIFSSMELVLWTNFLQKHAVHQRFLINKKMCDTFVIFIVQKFHSSKKMKQRGQALTNAFWMSLWLFVKRNTWPLPHLDPLHTMCWNHVSINLKNTFAFTMYTFLSYGCRVIIMNNSCHYLPVFYQESHGPIFQWAK